MKRCTEELRQKKMGKNIGYSVLPSSNQPMSTTYMSKPRIDTSSIATSIVTSIGTRPEYLAPPLSNPIKKEVPAETKSFMDEEDEEVSVAFEELMTEIAKYEGGDKKPTKI